MKSADTVHTTPPRPSRSDWVEPFDATQAVAWGERMFAFVRQLYPICRSVTGDGLRQTLDQIGQQIPLSRHEVASGTRVLDWTIPDEWNIRDAWIEDAQGRRIVDFQDHNLHVVNFSVPVDTTLTWQELDPHLHSLPEHPDWIPYRTTYYQPEWGFCITHRQREALARNEQLQSQTYRVRIDSTLRPGSLSYGQFVMPGKTDREVLLSSHICHPSLANDNLSSVAVAVALARHLASRPRRYTYRIVFAPGTIGAVTWLHQHQHDLSCIQHGFVLALLGAEGPLTYKRTRRGNALTDRIVERVLRRSGQPFRVLDFEPCGYDERQYGSPGFNLAVGRLSRSKEAEYPQYHTSADDLNLVSPAVLVSSLQQLIQIVECLDASRTYVNTVAFGEPQLGRHQIYDALEAEADVTLSAVLWVLNLSDGQHTLEDIVERSGCSEEVVQHTISLLCDRGLLEEQG